MISFDRFREVSLVIDAAQEAVEEESLVGTTPPEWLAKVVVQVGLAHPDKYTYVELLESWLLGLIQQHAEKAESVEQELYKVPLERLEEIVAAMKKQHATHVSVEVVRASAEG